MPPGCYSISRSNHVRLLPVKGRGFADPYGLMAGYFLQLLLPPIALGWILVVVWILFRRRPTIARWLLLSFMLSVIVLGCWPVSYHLFKLVEMRSTNVNIEQGQAIVILSAGRRLEYNEKGAVVSSHPSPFTYERIFAGARLAKSSGLPIMVSGGAGDGRDPTEARVLKDILESDFGLKVTWMEDKSRNTVENATFSARILLPLNMRKIVLVTSAFHMRRALRLFERAGFEVIPISVNPSTAPPGSLHITNFIPNISALYVNYFAIHEIVGLAYDYLQSLTDFRPNGGT